MLSNSSREMVKNEKVRLVVQEIIHSNVSDNQVPTCKHCFLAVRTTLAVAMRMVPRPLKSSTPARDRPSTGTTYAVMCQPEGKQRGITMQLEAQLCRRRGP